MKLPLAACLLLWIDSTSASAHSITPAQTHLERALQLSNAFNWVDAGPEFVEAERLFVAEKNQKSAYQARLGRMRSTIERGGALPQVILQLEEDLDSLPFLKSDPRLRMFCLIVKGDFDNESDHGSMSRDWEEVRNLATRRSTMGESCNGTTWDCSLLQRRSRRREAARRLGTSRR